MVGVVQVVQVVRVVGVVGLVRMGYPTEKIRNSTYQNSTYSCSLFPRSLTFYFIPPPPIQLVNYPTDRKNWKFHLLGQGGQGGQGGLPD